MMLLSVMYVIKSWLHLTLSKKSPFSIIRPRAFISHPLSLTTLSAVQPTKGALLNRHLG
ncbi:hypothetical protein J4Q44_G00151310 [Coregonus suidteri]|uniref:Uncharacterized protein n=1 Tax=Coregonus suidteri TaxID=861788 RepID=A0AAN8R567_9TELE